MSRSKSLKNIIIDFIIIFHTRSSTFQSVTSSNSQKGSKLFLTVLLKMNGFCVCMRVYVYMYVCMYVCVGVLKCWLRVIHSAVSTNLRYDGDVLPEVMQTYAPSVHSINHYVPHWFGHSEERMDQRRLPRPCPPNYAYL